MRTDEQVTKVYLTDRELQALYAFSLKEGSLKYQVRDIFLCGVYTEQRISDYNNFNKDNFRKSSKGFDIVSLVQEKTNATVVVPILNKNLIVIAEKYNYSYPKLNE